MENSFFIKFEIFVFLASFLYIIYYLFDKFYRVCGKVKAMVSPAPKEKLKKGKAHRVKLDNDSPTQSKHQKTQLSSDQRDKLNEILKRVKVNVTK
jgi:CBS domain containing-hemolysin-like protein